MKHIFISLRNLKLHCDKMKKYINYKALDPSYSFKKIIWFWLLITLKKPSLELLI